jgi:hypothetical protein
MPIINPPIVNDVQEDSWKQQATELIRQLEYQVQELQQQKIELEARVKALE